MWSAALVWAAVSISAVGAGGELYDVTTVYDIGNACIGKSPANPNILWIDDDEVDPDSETEKPCDPYITGRVHKRTNARGLPLDTKYEYSSLVSSSSLVRHPNCDSLFGCHWKTGEDWVNSVYYSKIQERLTVPFEENIYLKFNHSISTVTYLFLTTSPFNLREEIIFHLMSFETSGDDSNFYTNCSTNNFWEGVSNRNYMFNVKDRDGAPIRVGCETLESYFYTGYTLRIYIDSSMKMTVYSDTHDRQFQWYTSSTIKYYSLYEARYTSYLPSIGIPVLTSNTVDNEIISPMMNLKSNRLCLILIVHYDDYIFSDQLQILAEDIYGERHHVYTINNALAGWQAIRVNETLKNNMDGEIKLVIKTLDSETVQIRWISTCDCEDEDVELLPPKTAKKYSLELPNSIYGLPTHTIDPTITLLLDNDILEGGDASEGCYNGGIMTSAGCACPAGFEGYSCKTGCGRNRFGQDCGGVCSLHTRECKGMLLCSPFTKCTCAPGYTGEKCDEQCSPGRYGNDCSQLCGHCGSGSSCDIYTGECQSCDLGYVTPHCTEAYVHYSMPPELSSDSYRTMTVTFYPRNNTSGYGTPKLYQIQYREQDEDWKTYVTKIMPTKVTVLGFTVPEDVVVETIEDLKEGVLYEVRVILLDVNYNKYDGDLVKVSMEHTMCDVPEHSDYNVITTTNTSSFTFSWSYNNSAEHSCPVVSYEVSWEEDWRWLSDNTLDTRYSLTDYLPASTVLFKVRAQTSLGFAPYSQTETAVTHHHGSSGVEDLRIISSASTSAEISWFPPVSSEGRKLRYVVSYKCVNQLACSPGCKDAVEGRVTQEDTKITLSPLLPFTQYLVTVTPEDGPPSEIYLGTSEAVPEEIPSLSHLSPIRTNTSLTVFWTPATVCSSYLTGYNYQILKESDSLKILESGFTRNTLASFHNLTASTNYTVKIYVVTIAGWNPLAYLSINTSTSATVPEAVRNLAVYKRGRSMLGLRWAAPKATYGILKSFTVTHSLGKHASSHTVEPTPCVVWPELYCYTISNLRPNRRYSITVSARNADVAEDGVGASVDGLTKEASPTAPENLRVANRSSTSVGLRWDHPALANGILRSFLVSVEETEKFDQDSCCQVYPLVEVPVTQENAFYDVEVSGLHPASTYFVSVSAKSVGLGPAQSLAVTTRPPHLPVTVLPPSTLPFYFEEYEDSIALEEHLWSRQEGLSDVNNSDIYSPLIKAHLVLVLIADSHPNNNKSCILDPKLDLLLHTLLASRFAFHKEYNQDEYMEVSDWGRSEDCSPVHLDRNSRLVAAQVTEYGGTYNVDFRYYNYNSSN